MSGRMLQRTAIVVALTLGTTAIGVWARQITTFDIVASRFRFDPDTITVQQGEKVRLRLRSTDRSHSFAIKAFRVKTLIPKAGEVVTVDFVADRAGTFDFTCAEYCGTGHSAMKGKLVVLANEQ